METSMHPYGEYSIQVRATPHTRADCWIGHYLIRHGETLVVQSSLDPLAMPPTAARSRALDHAMLAVDRMSVSERVCT